MRVLRCAALGCAVALTAASAHAQNVITRQVDNEPVETTVTQTPTGTVITRRPIAPAAIPAAPATASHGARRIVEVVRIDVRSHRPDDASRATAPGRFGGTAW